MQGVLATVLPVEGDPHPVDPELPLMTYFHEQGFEPEPHDICAEVMGEGVLLLYNRELFKKGPINTNFDRMVRGVAPYAPIFKGTLVVLHVEREWDEAVLVENLKAKWRMPAEPDEEEANEFGFILSQIAKKTHE